MQMLLKLLGGLIAMLAAVALSQFGVDLNARRTADHEIQRVQNCNEPAASSISVPAPRDC